MADNNGNNYVGMYEMHRDIYNGRYLAAVLDGTLGYYAHIDYQDTKDDLNKAVLLGPYSSIQELETFLRFRDPNIVDVTDRWRDNEKLHYKSCVLFGVPALYSEQKVDIIDIPDNMFCYNITNPDPHGFAGRFFLEDHNSEFKGQFCGSVLSPYRIPFADSFSINADISNELDLDKFNPAGKDMNVQEFNKMWDMNKSDLNFSEENMIFHVLEKNEDLVLSNYGIIPNIPSIWGITAIYIPNDGRENSKNPLDYELGYAWMTPNLFNDFESIKSDFGLSDGDIILKNDGHTSEAVVVNGHNFDLNQDFLTERKAYEQALTCIDRFFNKYDEIMSRIIYTDENRPVLPDSVQIGQYDYSDLSNIFLAENNNTKLSVSADLHDCKLNKYMGSDLIYSENYGTLSNMVEKCLKDLTADNLFDVPQMAIDNYKDTQAEISSQQDIIDADIQELASDINKFIAITDPDKTFGFCSVDSRESEIKVSIKMHDTEELTDWLDDIIATSSDEQDVRIAESFKSRLEMLEPQRSGKVEVSL